MSIQTHFSESKSEDGIKYIYLKGSLDIYNTEDVGVYIEHILEKTSEQTIIFDLENLTNITAQGIGMIVRFFSIHENIYIMNANNKIQEMFDLLGFKSCCQFITQLQDINKEKNIFPKTIECCSCGNKIKVFKSGKIICGSCKRLLSIDKKGFMYEKN